MNAGANKDDVKEKRKTSSWNDETKIFALREIVRAGAHLPKNLRSKRLTAAASCMQDYLFQDGPELTGKNLGDQFQKCVTSWKAKWLDPRHNKSGMDGKRKTNMPESGSLDNPTSNLLAIFLTETLLRQG